MIPKGTGWQRLRSLCFDTIPSGSGVYHTRAVPLHEWRELGAFNVTLCNKQRIILETAGSEIGGTLMADAEYLLDNSAEHQASVHDAVTGAVWYSPAWLLITAYYWSFFSTLALSRLTGKSTWFLDRQALSIFRKLGGVSQQPPAGAMRLRVGTFISAINREITLEPSGSQLHDAVWKAFKELADDIFGKVDQNANGLEYRLWWALKRIGDIWGPAWPSKVRNAANYKPGRVYREVVRQDRFDTLKLLKDVTPITHAKLVELLEDQVLRIRAKETADSPLEGGTRILLLFAITLNAVATNLHSELINRQTGDQRWFALRKRFCDLRCATTSGSIWPLSEDTT